ncbi:hypothetical protein MPTK1_1g11100 [Marchantia polymorpha subsp. ruderalis]|uniref:Uncharacterized protein n=1 Tax=Marchantia polymorpha subsp. ruderalis TaxID=1480154 RepID=A0AAF6ANW5_MARPO|nr:hypothetical protein Mp_1g11100 [Marchantia polymorpha subsp. ruderalis]
MRRFTSRNFFFGKNVWSNRDDTNSKRFWPWWLESYFQRLCNLGLQLFWLYFVWGDFLQNWRRYSRCVPSSVERRWSAIQSIK